MKKRTAEQIRAQIKKEKEELNQILDETTEYDDRGFIKSMDYKAVRRSEDYINDLYWELRQLEEEKL